LGITVDGHKELHDACRVFPDGKGSYDIAIAAVHHYAEVYHGGMSSKVTLAPANIQHTYEALKHLIEEGYTSIHCNCVFEKGWTLEHATCLYYELKKIADYILDNNLADTHSISMFAPHGFHPMSIEDNTNWCGGNGQMIAVDYKGDIYPCLRYMESSLGNEVPPIIIGNVETGIM
jgi:sulfatase maturation enzyme AslB (radical SAM superfamily)